ncbi:exodeoxyribonuclease VII large subunit [bacterium]|nr:exodeoxyribonuclease VII large subunit [bacterium]
MAHTGEKEILTVSQLSSLIRGQIESIFPSGFWVKGEVRNFKKHSSGHLYFVLRDKDSQINCIMWRSKAGRLGWSLEEGMEVEIFGFLSIYEKSGNYNCIADRILPLGVGSRAIAFRQLKVKLENEGLFDPAYKKPLPIYPRTIGVITASTGAAIRDIINVLRRRAPYIKIILRPSAVQGDNAPADLIAALDEFNLFPGTVDLIIIGRGGGSEEDLWCFNDELLARAIFQSRIPVISAVGHEVDFSISDFVADRRAPTPSAAAEIAVPDHQELMQNIHKLWQLVYRVLNHELKKYQERFQSITKSYGFRRPRELLVRKAQVLDELVTKIIKETQIFTDNKKSQFSILREKMLSLSPEGILKRGYSICYNAETGVIIRNSDDLNIDDQIILHFAKGKAEGKVTKIIS